MNSDKLDTLSDYELSETFSVEVAKILRREVPRNGGLRAYSVVDTGAWREIMPDEDSSYWYEHFGDWAMDANAVMQYLPNERGPFWTAEGGATGVSVCIRDQNGWIIAEGKSPSFARSSCITLIRAYRNQYGAKSAHEDAP